MAPQPQGVHLEQGRPLAGPGPRHRVTGRRVHGLDIVVLDPLAGDAVGGGPVRVRADGRGRLPGHRDRPVVVLDHEDHGQLPQRGQVQRLVERALVGGTLAGERDRHPARSPAAGTRTPARSRAAAPRRQCPSRRNGSADRTGACARPGPGPDRSRDRRSRPSSGPGRRPCAIAMWWGRWVAVTASSRRRCAQTPAATGSCPADRCISPGDQPRPDVERWLLVRVVLAENRFLVGAAEHHHPVELKTGLVVHDASFTLAGSMP